MAMKTEQSRLAGKTRLPSQPHRRVRWGILGLVAAVVLMTPARVRADLEPAEGRETPLALAAVHGEVARKLQLTTGRNAVLTTGQPYRKVSVASPEVADVNTIGVKTLLVTGKRAGTTQIMVWDDEERSQVYDIEVAPNLGELMEQLKLVLPGADVHTSNANGTLVLRGRVASLDQAKQAGELAAPYAQKVLNFLEVSGGQQVMLQVRFAEVSRSALSQLGVNMGFADGVSSAASNVGQVAPFAAGGPGQLAATNSPAVTLLGGGQLGSTQFQVFLNALRQNNLLRTLADPNLVTVSGQEASFLAGGKFPVPVPQVNGGANTTITVDYQEFGVRLNFTPVVLGDGRIRLKVTPEVSDLDFSNGLTNAGFKIPLINTRRVNTTVEMAEGQTFAIAGLLSNNLASSSDTTPLLGDLPVLGTLFRSVRYQKRETELLVLVTPRLVEPMNPGQVPAAPGEHWREPNESDLFLKGDLGGPRAVAKPGDVEAAETRVARQPKNFEGSYGFQPVATTGNE